MSGTVAVLTPIHNGALYLEQFRRTLEAQSSPPDEILVLDDGSTDETLRLLKAWSQENVAVSILQHPHRTGRGAARQALLEQVSSDFVTWLDVDDRWHPRKLELQRADFLATHYSQPTIICSPYLRMNERTGATKRIDLPCAYGAEQYQRIGADALPPVMLQAVYGPREAFLLAGGFDPSMNLV